MNRESPREEVPIACNPNAVPPEQREAWVAVGTQVYASAVEVLEVPNGYRFRLPSESETLIRLADYIRNERLCCPFLEFAVDVELNHGPIWLTVAGGKGVKEYIRTVFEKSGLVSKSLFDSAH
jgi:uncharacterized Fe-S cluster-containing protein